MQYKLPSLSLPNSILDIISSYTNQANFGNIYHSAYPTGENGGFGQECKVQFLNFIIKDDTA